MPEKTKGRSGWVNALLVLAVLLTVAAVGVTLAQILIPHGGIFREQHVGTPRATALVLFTYVVATASWLGYSIARSVSDA